MSGYYYYVAIGCSGIIYMIVSEFTGCIAPDYLNSATTRPLSVRRQGGH